MDLSVDRILLSQWHFACSLLPNKLTNLLFRYRLLPLSSTCAYCEKWNLQDSITDKNHFIQSIILRNTWGGGRGNQWSQQTAKQKGGYILLSLQSRKFLSAMPGVPKTSGGKRNAGNKIEVWNSPRMRPVPSEAKNGTLRPFNGKIYRCFIGISILYSLSSAFNATVSEEGRDLGKFFFPSRIYLFLRVKSDILREFCTL